MRDRTNVKINLGLRVLGRRSDGFHDLETLFVPWSDLGDELEITPASRQGKVRLIAEPSIDWPADKDLCVRAYRALDADWDLPPVEIRLSKGVPTGSGLGGGSADAAWTLRMLRDMFRLPLSDEDLARYAASLGSDCPFFIYNRPMLARGRGEVLEPFDLDLKNYELRVEVPEGVSVNTGEAYRAIDAARAEKTDLDATGQSLAEILSLPPEQWRGRLVNDFEAPVFAAWPQIAALKESMYERGAVYAAMSGSGAAVFGLFPRA